MGATFPRRLAVPDSTPNSIALARGIARAAPRLALVLAAIAMSPDIAAKIVETVLDVPVKVISASGLVVEQTIKVTVFHDNTRFSAPYLILNHGRPYEDAKRAAMKRIAFPPISRWFVERGFAVIVPTRIGYGYSGGSDVENSGACAKRNYPPAYAAAADESIAALEFARRLPYVDLRRGVVVGQSFGGATAITLSTRDMPGLVGAINFAGGGGGNPETHPEKPCSPAALAQMFRDYGKISKVPTLWLYSENDRYFGIKLPRQWFDDFVGAGGKGRFVELPAYKDNGHLIFEGNPDAWKPAVEQFLHDLGFGR
jgi:dienelactone hydrolase